MAFYQKMIELMNSSESSSEPEKKVPPKKASRDEIIGLRAYEIAHKSDGGTENWRAVSAARDQLQQVITHITGTEALEHVFVFGGCLAFGIWDGQSDVDFSVLDVEKWTLTKETSRTLEERRVEQVDNALQVIGFPRSALTRLQGTRVPIVKHKTATKGRSALKAAPYTQCYVRFNRRVQELEPTALLAAVNAKGLSLDGAPKWTVDERDMPLTSAASIGPQRMLEAGIVALLSPR